MPFVARDNAVIVGIFARPQPGRAEEFLADTHADVVAYKNIPPPPVPLTVEELYDMLESKGVLNNSDRPRGRP